MKANITLVNGRNFSKRIFEFSDPKKLSYHLAELHRVEPNGWIFYSIEDEEVVE